MLALRWGNSCSKMAAGHQKWLPGHPKWPPGHPKWPPGHPKWPPEHGKTSLSGTGKPIGPKTHRSLMFSHVLVAILGVPVAILGVPAAILEPPNTCSPIVMRACPRISDGEIRIAMRIHHSTVRSLCEAPLSIILPSGNNSLDYKPPRWAPVLHGINTSWISSAPYFQSRVPKNAIKNWWNYVMRMSQRLPAGHLYDVDLSILSPNLDPSSFFCFIFQKYKSSFQR